MTPQSILIDEKLFCVNMTYWIGKGYAWIIDPKVLYDILYKFYKKNTSQKIVFDFIDGENLFFSGAAEFIKYCQSSLQIPKKDLYIRSFNTCQLEYATHIQLTSIFFSTDYKYEIRNKEFDKKFLSLSGRFDINRLRLTMHLHEHWRNDSIIGWFTDIGHAKHNLRRCESFFQKELEWVKAYAPLHVDAINALDDNSQSTVNWEDSMRELSKYYHRYLIDIVIETDTWNPLWITEKTVRSFIFGKPFILYNGYRSLEYLKSLGFKTFSPWINEEYDKIENHIDRLDAIICEIDRLAAYDYQDLRAMAAEMQAIFEHNKFVQQKKFPNRDYNKMWIGDYNRMWQLQ